MTAKPQYPVRRPISRDHLSGLVPCRECGAPLLQGTPPRRAQGDRWHPDVPMSPYEAVNLLAALACVRDTGSWHAQLRARAEQVLATYGDGTERPVRPVAEMLKTRQEIPDG